MIAITFLGAIGGLIWTYTLSGRITHQEAALNDATQQNLKMAAELRETNARLTVATDELGKSLGLTQKQMDTRAQQIIQREQADSRRLETAQKQTAQQVTAVSSAVTDVKTDVGGVKTDLGKTQNDLAGAISQLTSMKGDLSDHSSLIARNASELEVLKHKGDRNYYEFTLNKGDKKPVGTVSLELKKADPKKSRFTYGRVCRRQALREEGQERGRAAPVLQREGACALRDRGEQYQLEEPGVRVSLHAQECAGTGHRSVTATWGCRNDVGLVAEAEGVIEAFARVPLLLVEAKG